MGDTQWVTFVGGVTQWGATHIWEQPMGGLPGRGGASDTGDSQWGRD